MNTLHAPGNAPASALTSALANAPACAIFLRHLAAHSLNAARARTPGPASAPLREDSPLWLELLRSGLHGAALGMVTGLSIVLFNRIAELL